MEISLIIRTPLEDAYRLTFVRRFIQTAIEQGHTIRQCFFQSVGVLAATQPEQLSEWQQIADITHAELLLCSQAVEEHAVSPEGPFQIGGLGALVEAAVRSDRLMSFV
ncbi:MAG: DsrE family protein [Pseudomonadota bacterium]|nr:DsrE family protein [Pseudomonadota bacterium]